MGINNYWQLKEVIAEEHNVDDMKEAIEAALPNASGTILVDAGVVFSFWVTATERAWSPSTVATIASDSNFMELAYQRAEHLFKERFQEFVGEISQHVNLVYVVWDNPRQTGTAKDKERERRQVAFASGHQHFLWSIKKLYKGIDPKSKTGSDLIRVLQKHSLGVFGPPPLPRDYLFESSTYFSWTAKSHGIYNICAIDEADLGIARAERLFNDVAVITHDSDFLALVNCNIIRLKRRNKLTVIPGRRSATEMVAAAIVGSDYSPGLPGYGWIKAKALIKSTLRYYTPVDAIQLAEIILRGFELEDGGHSLLAGITIWQNRTHGNRVRFQHGHFRLTSTQILESALAMDESFADLKLPFALDGDIARRLIPPPTPLPLDKDKRQAISRRPMRVHNKLPDMIVNLQQRETPIPSKWYADRTGQNVEEEEENEEEIASVPSDEDDEEEGKVKRNNRRNLGYVYPRKFHCDKIELLVNRFPTEAGMLFTQKEHPLIHYFRALAIAKLPAMTIFQEAMTKYFQRLQLPEHHHLLAKVNDFSSLRSVLTGIRQVFNSDIPQTQPYPCEDVYNGMEWMDDDLIEIGRNSHCIDAAMLHVRRHELQHLPNIPSSTLLFSKATMNDICRGIELKIRMQIERCLRKLVEGQFSELDEGTKGEVFIALMTHPLNGFFDNDISLPARLDVRQREKLQDALDSRNILIKRHGGSMTPAKQIAAKNAVPLLSWFHYLGGNDKASGALQKFKSSNWSVAGIDDISRMIYNAKSHMSQILRFIDLTIYGKLAQLSPRYIREESQGGIASPIMKYHEWEPRWDRLTQALGNGIGQIWCDDWDSKEDKEKEKFAKSILGYRSGVPLLLILDFLFRCDTSSDKCIFSGTIGTDGYKLNLGLFNITRGEQTVASQGMTDVIDILLAEGQTSVLVGLPVNAKSAEVVKARRVMRLSPSIIKVSRRGHSFVFDSTFSLSIKTRGGLPRDIRWVQKKEDGAIQDRVIFGVDLGEVVPFASIVARPLQDGDTTKSEVKGLALYSKEVNRLIRKKTDKTMTLQSGFHFKLDLIKAELDRSHYSHVSMAAKWAFEASPIRRIHAMKSALSTTNMYKRIIQQFIRESQVTIDEVGSFFLGNAFQHRDGVSKGIANVVARKIYHQFRVNFPGISFYLCSEYLTSQRCCDANCRQADATRSQTQYPSRGNFQVYRLLMCEKCKVVRHRDIMASINIAQMGTHYQRFGVPSFRGR